MVIRKIPNRKVKEENLKTPEEELISQWDVSDIDPTTMFIKDCRYYNGGRIAPENERQSWYDPDNEKS